MEWEFVAPVIIMVVLTLTVGGVLLLRPIAKRLGDIVELMLRGKQEGAEGELRRMGDLLENVDARMRLLEERQDFTERLLGAGDRAKDIGSRCFDEHHRLHYGSRSRSLYPHLPRSSQSRPCLPRQHRPRKSAQERPRPYHPLARRRPTAGGIHRERFRPPPTS